MTFKDPFQLKTFYDFKKVLGYLDQLFAKITTRRMQEDGGPSILYRIPEAYQGIKMAGDKSCWICCKQVKN